MADKPEEELWGRNNLKKLVQKLELVVGQLDDIAIKHERRLDRLEQNNMAALVRAVKEQTTALNRIGDALFTMGNFGQQLESIEKGGLQIMSKIDDLNAVIDGLVTTADGIAADEKVLADEIQALKDQVAAGGAATEAQLQGVLDKANALKARLEAIDASVPPAAPGNPGTPGSPPSGTP